MCLNLVGKGNLRQQEASTSMDHPMTTIQAFLIALIQGITELFPVSSLGHAVIVPALLHWSLDEKGITFLPFLVMLHVGTAAALLLFFWRDWSALALGSVGVGASLHVQECRHILALVITATIPAVLIGYLFESALRQLFGSPEIASIFLILNGGILLAADRLRSNRSRGTDRPIASLTMTDALLVGCWQCLAFLPGISRSGVTITGALLRGVNHQTAARFSFLIALPVILAATASQLLRLHHLHLGLAALKPAILGALVAGVTAWLSTAFLMHYFKDHESRALTPFGIYSALAGLSSFLVLRFFE